ncbi:unnamed protein product [Dibothriocephalus latus]|uniref:Uncharacterized protein n=1 Tax=Dibothriocephalus latus TaxID=60516 RepID=A0A3P7P579_DIBLA|nr:unnamed protein product [Dibothriocephalus latus]
MPRVDGRRRSFGEIGGGDHDKETFLVFGPSQGSEEHGWLLQTYDTHASSAHIIGHIQRRDFACVVLVNAPMRTERSYHGAVVSAGDIVVGGGFDIRGRLATCEAYVVNTNE